MKAHTFKNALYVISLTLASSALLSCSAFHSKGNDLYPEECKTRAYIQNELPLYVNRRFHSKSPVRMAIIPFAAPENVAAYNNEMPGLGNYLVREVHGEMLRTGEIPIVEIFNRQDWPGKKEDFFSGNFNALRMAKDAGYDLVMVGYIDSMRSLDSMTVQTRIMEVDSGISIWYAESTVASPRREDNRKQSRYWMDDWTPNKIPTKDLTHKLARCVVNDVMTSEPIQTAQ